VERTERIELLEVDVGDARLLLELAARRLVKGLVDSHEAAGQRPRVLERRQLALDQQHLEVGPAARSESGPLHLRLAETEHDTIHRERRSRILVRVARHRSAFPIATNARISASSRS